MIDKAGLDLTVTLSCTANSVHDTQTWEQRPGGKHRRNQQPLHTLGRHMRHDHVLHTRNGRMFCPER